MYEITPAIAGITLVLTAVFIPMGFAQGSVGIIYRQFCISMAISILLSAFLALTLTPALCATLLKPHAANKRGAGRFATWFNTHFHVLTAVYASSLGAVLKNGAHAAAVCCPLRCPVYGVVFFAILIFAG